MAKESFNSFEPQPPATEEMRTYKDTLFQEELTTLLNRYSMENHANVHDYVLAEYIMSVLAAFNAAVRRRDGARGA